MGLFLMGALFVGCALGLIVTAMLGAAGVFVAFKSAKTRSRVWRDFAVVFGVVLLLCLVVVHRHPYAVVRPGSDYDVAMKNLFLRGFAYCASPGPSALLAGLLTLLRAKTTRSRNPEP